MPENQLFSLSPTEFFSSLPVSTIWIIIALIVVTTLIYSVIFLYHWSKYSIKRTALPYFTVLVYITGTLFLLSIIVGAGATIFL